MRRSFHWKRLLLVLGVFALLAGGLYAVNRAQVRRQGSAFLDAAKRAEADASGDPAKLAEAIRRYADYSRREPDDEPNREHLVKLLLEQQKADPTRDTTESAVRGLEDFLRRFPEHPDLRRKLADLYLKGGRVANAREHLEMIYNAPKGDAKKNVELLESLAVCEQASGELGKAIDRFEEAIAAGRETDAPVAARVRVYQQALDLLDKNTSDGQRETKIANHLRTLLNEPPFRDNIDARVVVARFELNRTQLQNARRDVAQALKLAGNTPHADALTAAAELEMVEARMAGSEKPRREHITAARDHLRKAHDADRKNVPVGVFLADVLERLGERKQAVEVLRTVAEALGEVNDLFVVALDHMIDLGEQAVTPPLVDRIAARAAAQNQFKTWVTYFKGRLAVLKGEWIAGKAMLEEAAPNLVGRQHESHKRAMGDLARVYEALQNPDQQLECCRRALRDPGPVYPPALIGEAVALAKLGKFDEAIAKYQTLVTQFQATRLRPDLVRLRLVDTLRRPPESRNWELFDSADNLGPEEDRTDDVLILQAQSLAARGEKDRAVAILERITKRVPRSPLATTAWVNLARVREAGRPAAALQILDEAQKEVGDTVDIRLARADVLVFRPKPPAVAEFELLGYQPGTEFEKKTPPPERYRLWFGLGQAALTAAPRLSDPEARRGMLDAATRFFRTAATLEPGDLHSRAKIIDLAVVADNKDAIQATLKELETLEGADGPIRNLARVVVALPEIPTIRDEAVRKARIKELRELAAGVQKQRPFWGRAYVALGRLDELDGLTESAVENFRKALENGEREEYVIRRTVQIYRERKQDATAAGVLDGLATKMILPDDLERFRAIYEMLNRPVPRAELSTINRIAPADSKDYKILMLRGSLLAAVREDAKALEAFRAAVLMKGIPETYEAVVGQLVRTGQFADAKVALAEAERALAPDAQKTPADRADVHVTLARMSEVLGDTKTAFARLQKAVEAAPGELNPHRRLVEFLMRHGRAADAEKTLVGLTASPGQDVARWARRYLAAVVYLARPNPYDHRGAALALIEKNLAVSPNDPEDVKARAVIWTVDPVTREEGVRVLQDFWKKQELTPDEAFLLGRLTFDLGPSKIVESEKYFEYAARPRPGVTAEHIAGLIRVYAALNALDKAEAQLERLKVAAPNGWEAAREEARLLMRRSREAAMRADREDAKKLSDRARALVLKLPGFDSVDVIRFRTGPLLEELGLNADAEALYRKLLADWDSPTAHLPLAVLYVREKKSAEAIALAKERAAKAPVVVTALLYTGAVRASRPGEKAEAEIADWLEKRIAEHAGKPELPALLGAKAELLDAQGRYTDAIAEYRRSLKEGKSDTVVNNLAMLLALHEKKTDEAIRMMTDLINVRGPSPTFLDTRAVAYLVKGGDDSAKAAQDLEMALVQRFRPVYLFHLAWAYDLQGKRLERDRRLDDARKIGLGPDDVHPLEMDKFNQYVGPVPK